MCNDMEDAFMEGIDQDDVIQILKMFEESTFDELHLEVGALKLVTSKSSKKVGPMEGLKFDDRESTESGAAAEPTVQTKDKRPDIPQPSDFEEQGFIAIKAPMLGTFYSAPKPGAPPFVDTGRLISEDDTVCIIEVMKLFNTVKAGIRGRIARICAENGQMVEYQQTLFLVEELEGAETSEKENV